MCVKGAQGNFVFVSSCCAIVSQLSDCRHTHQDQIEPLLIVKKKIAAFFLLFFSYYSSAANDRYGPNGGSVFICFRFERLDHFGSSGTIRPCQKRRQKKKKGRWERGLMGSERATTNCRGKAKVNDQRWTFLLSASLSQSPKARQVRTCSSLSAGVSYHTHTNL